MKYQCLECFILFLVINSAMPKKYLGNIIFKRSEKIKFRFLVGIDDTSSPSKYKGM